MSLVAALSLVLVVGFLATGIPHDGRSRESFLASQASDSHAMTSDCLAAARSSTVVGLEPRAPMRHPIVGPSARLNDLM